MRSALAGWWPRWRGRAAAACPIRQELRRLVSCPGGGIPTLSLRSWLRSFGWEGRRLAPEEAT
eukprot:8682007-Lingulodinium_polyedra.AAC.1